MILKGMKYNLQFFAEPSENIPEVAEPDAGNEVEVESGATDTNTDTETDDVSDGGNEQEVAGPVQSAEENAAYAAARRKAELEIKARDSYIAKKFGHLTNPITGKNITSEKEYFDALDAQDQINRTEKLKEAGIDPNILTEAIESSPLVRQANEIIQQTRQAEAQRQIDTDLKAIQAIDPGIKSISDVFASDVNGRILDLVQNNGLNLADAYKVANFENLASKKAAAAQQKAINMAKGKVHMTSTDGVADSEESFVDIPKDEISAWERAYPELSYKEIKKKYNQSL